MLPAYIFDSAYNRRPCKRLNKRRVQFWLLLNSCSCSDFNPLPHDFQKPLGQRVTVLLAATLQMPAESKLLQVVEAAG